MAIREVKIDTTKDLKKRLERLAKDDSVYILYNVYWTVRRMYENANSHRAEADKINIDEMAKWEHCWRLRPFKEYYEQHKDETYFYVTFPDKLKNFEMVRLK